MSRVLAIANIKGGVGKTTTAANLAVALVERGRSVLAIDFDPQASLTFSLGVRAGDASKTISNALKSNGDALASVVRVTAERVDLVPAGRDLNRVAEQLESAHANITFLRVALEPLRHRYDYILIDCPANAGILTGAALVAADQVVIPLIPDSLSLQALSWLLFIVKEVHKQSNPALSVAGLLLTLYDPRTRHARDIIEKVHQIYGTEVPFFSAVVKESVRVREAVTAGRSIVTFAPDTQAAKAYRVLAEEIENGIAAPTEDELHSTLVRGAEAMQQNDFKAAFSAFCRATEINPKLAAAWVSRAESAPTWNECLRCLARALHLEPQNEDVRVRLEQRLSEKIPSTRLEDIPEMIALAHQFEEIDLNGYAEQLFRRVTELDAANEEARLGLVRTAPKMSHAVGSVPRDREIGPDKVSAQAPLTPALDRSKADAQKMVDEGNVLLRAGKRAEAHARFVQAVELDPQNDRAWVGCARTADDWHATADFARQALKLNPQNEEARGLYAATWESTDAEPEPARPVQLLRYLVPIAILLGASAILVAKLLIR